MTPIHPHESESVQKEPAFVETVIMPLIFRVFAEGFWKPYISHEEGKNASFIITAAVARLRSAGGH